MGFRELLSAVEILRDVAAIAAMACIAVGCWWIHPAAGLIVPGALVLAGLTRNNSRGQGK